MFNLTFSLVTKLTLSCSFPIEDVGLITELIIIGLPEVIPPLIPPLLLLLVTTLPFSIL